MKASRPSIGESLLLSPQAIASIKQCSGDLDCDRRDRIRDQSRKDGDPWPMGCRTACRSDGRTGCRGDTTDSASTHLDRLTTPGPANRHSAGRTTGAPLSLIKNTTNFARLVLLAFRPTT